MKKKNANSNNSNTKWRSVCCRKRRNIQVFDMMNIHQVSNGILNTKREKKILNRTVERKKLKKISHIYNSTRTAHHLNLKRTKMRWIQANERDNENGKNGAKLAKKIQNMMFVITINGYWLSRSLFHSIVNLIYWTSLFFLFFFCVFRLYRIHSQTMAVIAFIK